jgi:hypothetical protein
LIRACYLSHKFGNCHFTHNLAVWLTFISAPTVAEWKTAELTIPAPGLQTKRATETTFRREC